MPPYSMDMSSEGKTREMNTTEINRLLEQLNTGVLSFSGDKPYGVPVSYRRTSDSIYIKLGFTEGSRKMDLLERDSRVCLTVYSVDETTEALGPFVPFEWKSVIASGELREVESEKAVDVVIDAEGGPSPDNPWGEPRADIDFKLYELRIHEVTGRKGVGE